MHEAGVFENFEMARGRGPAVLEAFREVAAWQLTAGVAEEHDDVPARFVTEREEHGFDLGEVQRHTRILSLEANY